LGEVAEVLDLEPFSELGLERCKPCGIIAGCRDVIDVQRDHGEDVAGAENVDSRVRNAMLPPIVDEPCTEEHVQLAGGLLQAVLATLEVTHFGRAIDEAEGLADVHVFLNGCVETRCVDVKLAKLKVAGGSDGQEETHAGHADDKGERLSVI
jgi:hypothetical protein